MYIDTLEEYRRLLCKRKITNKNYGIGNSEHVDKKRKKSENRFKVI